jgi:hypothetical protein
MRNIVRNTAAGAVLGGSLLFTAGLGLAGAAPPSASNGVDLAIGNVKILQNASLDTASSVAGAVCNINTSQANTIAQKAATQSNEQTVCSLPGGVVTFSQAGSVTNGTGPAAAAPAVGTPNSPTNPMNPTNPTNPTYPSEQQPG